VGLDRGSGHSPGGKGLVQQLQYLFQVPAASEAPDSRGSHNWYAATPLVPQLQFHLRGPGGSGLVNADMFKGESGAWEYAYLIVDVAAGGSPPQRLNIIAPR
jgi:hypothetical protein